MSYFVYLLLSSGHIGQQTYVGATVDLDHRLRQHNKEIKGGAHATSIQVERGEIWERVCHVAGFPTWQAALQFEWRWKQLSRKIKVLRIDPLMRKIHALNQLLSLEQSTSKAVPYDEWPCPPQVIVESEKLKTEHILYSVYKDKTSTNNNEQPNNEHPPNDHQSKVA
jgi:structure-specific endonuclease subunit SLX1